MIIKRDVDIFDVGKELIDFYRQNPVIAAKDLLNVRLYSIQQVILEDIWFKRYNVIVAGRGTGKTFILGLAASLFAILYPGIKIGLISASFRQAKLIFTEVERLWQVSPIFQAAVDGKPRHTPDSYRFVMKRPAKSPIPAGFIEAIPLGPEGAKIRGSRFNIIFVDEFAQVPEAIFNTVISPMAATKANPMEQVLLVERYKPLLVSGEITEDEYLAAVEGRDSIQNRITASSSAFYKFNHLYRLFVAYGKLLDSGNKNYGIHQVSYRDVPEGFLDLAGVERALKTMSSPEFSMEYEAEFVSDSDGVFKASLVYSCVGKESNIKLQGDPDKGYVMAVDPARKRDDFAIAICELGPPHKLVYCKRYQDKRFQDSAKIIHDLYKKFNILRISIDVGAGGGGQAIVDLLEDMDPPLIDMEDEEGRRGVKVLELVNFSPAWIHEAVNSTKHLLENRLYEFPGNPMDTYYYAESLGNEVDDVFADSRLMMTQIVSIVATQTKTGLIHYDLPADKKSASAAHSQELPRKDLFTAFILSGKALYEMAHRPQLIISPIIPVGIVRPRDVRIGIF
jgi:hypothetical protein